MSDSSFSQDPTPNPQEPSPFDSPSTASFMSKVEELTSDEKLFAGLCYWGSFVLGFIPALVIYCVKKDSEFVRFHALQSLLLSVVGSVVGLFILLGLLFGLVIPVIQIFVFLGWLFLSIPLCVVVYIYEFILGLQAYKGKWCKVPLIGDYIKKS